MQAAPSRYDGFLSYSQTGPESHQGLSFAKGWSMRLYSLLLSKFEPT